MRTSVARGAAAAATLALLAVGGCGTEDAADPVAGDSSATGAASPTATASASEPVPEGSPACGDLWQDGSKLPRTYRGCADDGGGYQARKGIRCSSGQVMVTFEDRYYGVLGGKIHATNGTLEDDRDYRSSIRSCRA